MFSMNPYSYESLKLKSIVVKKKCSFWMLMPMATTMMMMMMLGKKRKRAGGQPVSRMQWWGVGAIARWAHEATRGVRSRSLEPPAVVNDHDQCCHHDLNIHSHYLFFKKHKPIIIAIY